MGLDNIIAQIRDQLASAGIALEGAATCVPGAGPVKVVCLSGRLGESLEAMNARPRDQVVMVRVGEEETEKLDAWVETGAVRSRSEAAALFIREGLQLRATELEQLRQGIRGVREAKERLREAASEILGVRDGAEDADEE